MVCMAARREAAASYLLAAERRECLLSHLALAGVGEEPRRLLERQPLYVGDLVRVLLLQIAEPARLVAEQEEADDLEDPLALPRVDVADVAEFADEFAAGPGLLLDLPHRRRLGLLPAPDPALRQRPQPLRLPFRPDRRHHRAAVHLVYENTAGRELTLHVRPTLQLVTLEAPIQRPLARHAWIRLKSPGTLPTRVPSIVTKSESQED